MVTDNKKDKNEGPIYTKLCGGRQEEAGTVSLQKQPLLSG